MNQRSTHNYFTSSMFPMMSPDLINKVNHRIDNVPLWANYFNSMQSRTLKNQGFINQKNPYDIFKLTSHGGHRKFGHDMLSAMLIGAAEARKNGMKQTDGMLASYAHLATDNFSNHLIKSMGIEGKNLFEALFSYNTRRLQSRQNKAPPI